MADRRGQRPPGGHQGPPGPPGPGPGPRPPRRYAYGVPSEYDAEPPAPAPRPPVQGGPVPYDAPPPQQTYEAYESYESYGTYEQHGQHGQHGGGGYGYGEPYDSNGSGPYNGNGQGPYGGNGQAPYNGNGAGTYDGNGRPYDYNGGYDYSEPFDYSAPPGQQGYPAQPGPGPGQGPYAQRPAPVPAPAPVPEPAPAPVHAPVPEREPEAGADAYADPAEGDGEDPAETGAGTGTGRRSLRGPGQGRADRRRAAKRIKRRRRLSATKEIPILIGVALLIALVLKTFLVQAFVIPSGSMEQTIKIGDRVLVDKLTPWFGSKPERGDVVVFKDPGGWLEKEKKKKEDPPIGIKQGKEFLTFIGLLPSDDEQDLIKRVVGVGGDTVRCCDKQGRVTVNGEPLNEPYLHPGNKPSQLKFKVQVPVGRVFVMGDHRSNSADSRYHLREPDKGTIPEDLVVGRAVVIAWPFGHWRRLEEPETYASVPDARGAPASASGASNNPVVQLPFSAELPLVMGVVGLYRLSDRRQRSVRSGCGGLGGWRTVRFRRSGGRASRRTGRDGRQGAARRGESGRWRGRRD
ncbi:signal peptidase I [Streptomyces sp. NPDC048172]|uniref:signal peptidase I n=1 Tax=Streptomyces sp. NPDC048172 TaxID=3365505 RepID=UPI00372340DA